jgi:hypothetical protein
LGTTPSNACAEQPGDLSQVDKCIDGSLKEPGGHKNVGKFCKCLGTSKKFSTIFQKFSDLLTSNCGLPLTTFFSKLFMLVYFKKNISLVFLGSFTLSSLNEFVSLFNVQDACEVQRKLRLY